MRRIIPKFLFAIYHWTLALAGAIWYWFPSRSLMVIGVTGTNGKSTVVHLLHEIFSTAGYRTASASSLRFIINDRVEKNEFKMTMPGRFFIQRFLWKARKGGCQVVILEVTSEGVQQFRHKFIDFDIAVMTNVTPEHIESHGSFDKYLESKLEFFRSLARSPKHGKAIIVNRDDNHFHKFIETYYENCWAYGFYFREAIESATHVVKPEFYDFDKDLLMKNVHFRYRSTDFYLRLKGQFNFYNALCALSVGLARGVDIVTIKKALESAGGVPGRLEFVAEKPFKVVVDYAHTPDALQKVYQTLAPNPVLQNLHRVNLICVLGSAGGGRDRWKRPEMGKIADEYCNEIILTDEDPYDEDPMQIIKDIQEGVKTKTPRIILDRKVAIKTAIQFAKADDTVIITGKGAEPWMMVKGGKKIPWDDRQVARDTLGS